MRALKTNPRELVLFRFGSRSAALFSWPAVRDGIKDFHFNGIEWQTNVDKNTPERATEMNKSVPTVSQNFTSPLNRNGPADGISCGFYFSNFCFHLWFLWVHSALPKSDISGISPDNFYLVCDR